MNNYQKQMDMPSESNYEIFEKWFTQNGGLHKKIRFPTLFPPTNYIGISALQDIKQSQVFLAIPKKLIISPSKARDSDLNSILQKYGFNAEKSDINESDVLLLFILWQKLKGEDSFYYPYFQAIGKPDIMVYWKNEDIEKIQDPYITVQFIDELRSQLPDIYKKFHKISIKHPQLFKTPISEQIFKECYSLVVSRCFGWGLPETFMVPYADFLNHDCHGVYHYALNKTLEITEVEQFQKQYIRKRNDLDLSILEIKNQMQTEKQQNLNARQKFIQAHYHLLEQKQNKGPTKENLNFIQQELLQQNYDIDLYPSSNSQDNDTEQDEKQPDFEEREQTKKQLLQEVNWFVKEEIEEYFQENRPGVNQQFEEGVTFSWWEKMKQNDSYFVVAAHKNIQKGCQVFNSYGRRSNRFLLIWYGFAHENNKYDSVAFRFWDEKISAKTGKILLAKYLTEKDWHQGIRLGNQRYAYNRLTEEYRLKKSRLNYELMAYLRIKLMNKKQPFRYLKEQLPESAVKIQSLDLQKAMLDQYALVLRHLNHAYQPDKIRQTLSTTQHNYFTTVFLKSNKQILQNHQRGVQILKEVIKKIQNGTTLTQTYKSNLTKQQNEISPSSQNRKRVRYENRRLTLDYFKMLSRFLQKQV